MSDLHPVHDDSDERESALGLALVTRLHGLLRAVRIYDLSNETVRHLLDEVLELGSVECIRHDLVQAGLDVGMVSVAHGLDQQVL